MSDNLIGATTAIFIVSLSIAVSEPVDVAWSTRDGTAKAGTDYQAANGVVSFLPGETQKQIEVIVYGQNVSPTGDKNFFINLMPPTNAVLGTTLIEAVIKVEDESGVPVTSVIVAQGKRGLKGDPGLSAYEQAVLMGYDGTLEDWMQEQADAAAAAQRAGDYAANAAAAAAKAENAATAASFLGNIFPTPEAGVDPVTGVGNGAYYNVRSPSDDSYLDEYQNIGGTPTPTGKSFPSSAALNDVKEQVAATIDPVTGNISASKIVDAAGNDLQAVNDDLLQPIKTRLASSINRALYDHVIDQVSVKDYGAIGDGTLHTVQEWIDSGKFSSLADIKTEYPHVTALTDSVDWAAMQLCINMRKNVYAPSGTYHFGDKRPDTPHSGSPNRADSSAYVFGDGCKTVFTRNAIAEPATRILKPDGSLDIAATDDINNAEATFAIHGSYYKFSDFMIQHSRVGFYFGQDLRSLVEKSACYKNIIRDIQVRRCGTGMLFSSAYGNHYNDISNIHFIENQIDCEMRNGKHDVVTIANNNRNYFTNIRSNRSIVGLWCMAGDTNRFTCWDGEGCGASPTNNQYPVPVGLPKLADGVTQITNGVHIFAGNGQLNKVFNCQMEACDVELYNNNYRNSFVNNGYHEAVANGTQVYNLQEPGLWLSHNTVFMPGAYSLSNLNANAFPTATDFGFVVKSIASKNHTGIQEVKTSRTASNYSRKRIYDIGAVAANGTATVNIWGDSDPSSAANIKVKVTALSSTSVLSFANEMAITAYRAPTKSLSRYYMQELYKLRASGQGAGDSSTVIVPTIANGGSSTRDLILTLTMPAYDMASVFVEVEIIVAKV